MYPKNSATPPEIAIGAVVQISDGAVQSSGCSVSVKPLGGSPSAGSGTVAYGTGGTVLYTPTQAETNYASFVVEAYKTGCVPVAMTIVTTASSTAGQVVVGNAVNLASNQSFDNHGNWYGNISGSVNSVSTPVEPDGAITAEIIATALAAQGYTITRAGKLDNLDASVSSRNATTPPTTAEIAASIISDPTNKISTYGYGAVRAVLATTNISAVVSTGTPPANAIGTYIHAQSWYNGFPVLINNEFNLWNYGGEWIITAGAAGNVLEDSFRKTDDIEGVYVGRGAYEGSELTISINSGVIQSAAFGPAPTSDENATAAAQAILLTPANKLATDSQNRVTTANPASVTGLNVQVTDKSVNVGG